MVRRAVGNGQLALPMHTHSHHSEHDSSDVGALRTAFLLNLVFTVIEFGGGLWTNSVAILSDAVHDAGDCLSVGTAWYLEHKSRRGPSALFTYGYRRLSVLGGMVTALVLVGGLVVVVWRAIDRLQHPAEVNAPGMIAFAVLGIVVNGAAVLRLRRRRGLNASIIGWHFIEDTLGWVAVLLGSIALMIWDQPIIDPLLSIGLSLFVLWNVVRNLRRVLLVFLQTAPSDFEPQKFLRAARQIPGVRSTHHTHSWSIDGERHVFSTHVVLSRTLEREDVIRVKQQLRSLLEPHHFEHTTIEIELEGEPCQAGDCRDEDAEAGAVLAEQNA